MGFYYLGGCYKLLGNWHLDPFLLSQRLSRGRISRRSNSANLERRLDEAVGKYMYRGRKRQSAAGEEDRDDMEMTSFISGTTSDRDAPEARPSAPSQDIHSGAYPRVPCDGSRAATRVGD